MAQKVVTFDEIKQHIASGKLSPVYLLHGKESYYLDLLAKEFERVIPDNDKEFNQYILFAPQVEPGQVMDLCYRYPMMAERQVVILKECQAVNATQINKLAKYVANPSRSTVFVMIFRGEDAKGKDLLAAAKSNASIYNSPEIRDYQMPQYIASFINSKGLTADSKSISMLNDFIGANLSTLANQIDKLASILPPGAKITPEIIEKNIGISKEYNSFELVAALSSKNIAKAMRIADNYADNPKANGLPPIVSILYNFYSNLLVAIYTREKTETALMNALKFKSRYQLTDINTGLRNYNAYQVIEAIWSLRKFDSQSKGNGSRQNAYDLFRDLIFHLITAPGNLGL